jgi:hypothetical protein
MAARRSRALLALLLALALCASASAQFPKKEKVKAPAVKSDIKCARATQHAPRALSRDVAAPAALSLARRYIRCGVCQELTKTLARHVRELREEKGAKARRASAGCGGRRGHVTRRLACARAPALTRSRRWPRAAQLKEADVLEKIEKVLLRAAPHTHATRTHTRTPHRRRCTEAPSFLF